MIKKILLGTLLIYSAGLVFILPYLYSSSGAYAISSKSDVWLSTQIQPDQLYWRTLNQDTTLPMFLNILHQMYPGTHLRLPGNFFRADDLVKAGMAVSLKSLEEGCSEHSLNDYRRRAKRHLLYTPFVFSPQHYRIVSRDPLVTEPPLREDYPVTMLFLPRAADGNIVNVIRCQQYLMFVPETTSMLPEAPFT